MNTGAVAASDATTRATVEEILADVAARGDAAVRDLSARFDDGSPAQFPLSEAEIETALSQVSKSDLDDIRFAQAAPRPILHVLLHGHARTPYG